MNIDNSQISRVFQNLIVNSIHSISESKNKDGEIIYSSYEVDDNVLLTLIDNGIGLIYDIEDLIKPYLLFSLSTLSHSKARYTSYKAV